MQTTYFMNYKNPFTKYEDWFELVERIKKWELRVLTNKRLWELLEYEAKIKNIKDVIQNEQLWNSCTFII